MNTFVLSNDIKSGPYNAFLGETCHLIPQTHLCNYQRWQQLERRQGDKSVALAWTLWCKEPLTNWEAESLFQSNCCLGLPSFIVQTRVSHHKCLGFSRFLHWHYIVWRQVPFLLFGLSTHFINLYERKGKENWIWMEKLIYNCSKVSLFLVVGVYCKRRYLGKRKILLSRTLKTSLLHQNDPIKRAYKQHCYHKATSCGFVTGYLDYSTPRNRLKQWLIEVLPTQTFI